MTLWNLIRDFFVENIFGGFLSDGNFIENKIGGLNSSYTTDTEMGYTGSLFYQVSNYDWVNDSPTPVYLGLGDWLSTTFTIITLILLVIVLYIFVKWIFRLFSGLLH